MPTIRLATAADLPAINAIYNHFVLASTCTYQEEPATAAERAAWFEKHTERYPVTVLSEGERVVGWGSLSPFHARSAYRFTAENSVYVHHEEHRRGYGRRLLADLLERAAAIGFREVIALISADQAASLGLHRAMGFVEAGLLRRVGFKFGRWLDVAYLQWSNPHFGGAEGA